MAQIKPVQRRLAMLATLTISVAIAVLSLMPVSDSGLLVQGSDKLKHCVAYAALAAPMTLWLGRRAIGKTYALVLAYGILMEYAQMLASTGREASVLDVVADAIGAGLGVGIALIILKLLDRH